MNSKKEKICFVVSSVLTAKFFLRYHIEKLSIQYDVYLVGNFTENDIKSISYFNLKGIKSIKLERKINLLNDIKSVIDLTFYFKEMQFNVVHSLAPKAGLICAISGKIAQIKNRVHIFTGQVWATKKGLFKLLLKFLDKIIVFLNTQILIDSHAQKDFLLSENVVTKDKSIVLGKGSISGVDTNRFKQNIKLKNKYRSQLNIDDNITVFLFMGRINEDKGIYDLANAFKLVLKEHDNVLLLVVGYDENNHIENIKNIINSDKHFFYFGSTDKPEDIINIGNIFCLPSYREGFGTSIIEASACKLAILCSDTYGLRDTIINNRTGLKHKTGNVIDLYKKMCLFLNDGELIKTFGNNGFEYIMSNFTAEMITNEWLTFYKELD